MPLPKSTDIPQHLGTGPFSPNLQVVTTFYNGSTRAMGIKGNQNHRHSLHIFKWVNSAPVFGWNWKNVSGFLSRVSGTTVLHAQSSGDNSNTTLGAGSKSSITLALAHPYSSSSKPYSTSNFTGHFTMNPTMGAFRISHSKRAGNNTLAARAFGCEGITTQKTFTLTVSHPAARLCTFTGSTNKVFINLPYLIAISNFNGDGRQDFAAAHP